MSGSPRENVGKKDARRLRREGLVPCVVYGGSGQVHFTAVAKDFKDVVYTPEACLVELTVGKKKHLAVLQEIQFHPVEEMIMHADFLEVFPDKEVKISVPVRITGNSPGVIAGGKLQLKMRKLRIQALPADLPDDIEVSISKLHIGDSVKLGELPTGKVTFLDPAHAVIVMVKSSRVVALGGLDEDEEAAGGEGATAPAEGETPPAE